VLDLGEFIVDDVPVCIPNVGIVVVVGPVLVPVDVGGSTKLLV
jgi:hypothetical protein